MKGKRLRDWIVMLTVLTVLGVYLYRPDWPVNDQATFNYYATDYPRFWEWALKGMEVGMAVFIAAVVWAIRSEGREKETEAGREFFRIGTFLPWGLAFVFFMKAKDLHEFQKSQITYEEYSTPRGVVVVRDDPKAFFDQILWNGRWQYVKPDSDYKKLLRSLRQLKNQNFIMNSPLSQAEKAERVKALGEFYIELGEVDIKAAETFELLENTLGVQRKKASEE